MTWLTTTLIILALLTIWFFYITRKSRDHNESVYGRFHRGYRRLVFWAGDIRAIRHFPFITWDVHHHKVEYDEAMQALPKIHKGDIGLHRDGGYLSNLAIPGFLIHAWIHVNDPERNGDIIETTNMQIVEAISDGVVKRHALHPIRSDYTIILRPKDVTEMDIERAVKKAESIVGARYDADFKFDIEEEIKLFTEEMVIKDMSKNDAEQDRAELDVIKNNMQAEWDGGFSCTETVSFAWWHKRRQLRLFRTKARGKEVILADDMINNGFEIVWMSDSVTYETAKKMNLGEEALEMIKEYREKHPVKDASRSPTTKTS